MPFRDSSVWLEHRSIQADCRSAVADEVQTMAREGLAPDRHSLAVNRVLDLEKF